MKDKRRVVLMYDDACCLCRASMKWIQLHAIRRDAFECIPCQSEERRIQFPEMTDETCRESLQLVLSDNRILAGDMALPEIIVRLKGLRWSYVLFKIPIIKALLYAIYHWIANNRYIISRTIKPFIEE
ncbi:MAG: DUF393 domain-containing protein [Candidatus Jettenia sp.]|nr:DUF393 domain-containing protein [Candidatus Jettenia sp.]